MDDCLTCLGRYYFLVDANLEWAYVAEVVLLNFSVWRKNELAKHAYKMKCNLQPSTT